MGIQSGSFAIPFTAGDGVGVINSTLNPEGVDLFITRCVVNLTTVATGAALVDIGIAAAAGTVDDRLLDGLDTNTAVGIFDNLVDPGTNGLAGLKWGAAEFLNMAEFSGDVTGQIGTMYVEYIRMTEEAV